MATVTTIPIRPTKNGNPWTIWEALLYFIQNVYDKFVNSLIAGSTVVPAGATTVVVTHSLGNAFYSVSLLPRTDPGGRYWVINKTSSQFTINLQVAAPGGGIPFDWMVKAL